MLADLSPPLAGKPTTSCSTTGATLCSQDTARLCKQSFTCTFALAEADLPSRFRSATQLQQDIFGKDKKKEFTAANRLQRKKKNVYIPLKDRRVPCLEEGDTPDEILRFELLVERIEAKGEDEEETEPVPLRHIIGTLKEALEKTTVPEEKKLLELESRRLKKEVSAKEKVADRLRAELSDVTKAFNSESPRSARPARPR
jgi:hypothetical protein